MRRARGLRARRCPCGSRPWTRPRQRWVRHDNAPRTHVHGVAWHDMACRWHMLLRCLSWCKKNGDVKKAWGLLCAVQAWAQRISGLACCRSHVILLCCIVLLQIEDEVAPLRAAKREEALKRVDEEVAAAVEARRREVRG